MAKWNVTHNRASAGFRVIKMGTAQKPGYVVACVKYPTSDKIYTYVRKVSKTYDNGDCSVIIDGCGIRYDSRTFEILSVVRLYDTSGRKRTVNFGSAGNGETVSKIKAELERQNIKWAADVQEAPQEAAQEIQEVDVVEEPKVEEPKEDKIDYEEGIVHHEEYDTIKTCILSDIPVYLAGPAGSGKNHTVEQIADELDWEFYSSNSIQQEYKLTGFIDAGGKYHETEFYKACTSKNDCIFFLDEIDASIPEVLVLLNAAIANGYFEFPTGRVELEHIHFVAAGNTVGSGADEQYTGRMVLDQATLDRFAIIEFNYSPKIEMAISKGNEELLSFVRQLREEAIDKGIRATFSYRCIAMVTKLENAGMDGEKIIKIAVMKGLDKDTINTFNVNGDTKYYKALRKLQEAT